MTKEDWTKMNKESHYKSLMKQDIENRRLIRKLQHERDELKKQLSIHNVSQQRELCVKLLNYYTGIIDDESNRVIVDEWFTDVLNI